MAKVIFLQACVCPRGGGGLLVPGGVSPIFRGVSNFSGGSPNFQGGLLFFGGVSNFLGGLQIFGEGVSNFLGVSKFFFFFFFSIFFSPNKIFWDVPPSPPETVNARPVRILLECILVCIQTSFVLGNNTRRTRMHSSRMRTGRTVTVFRKLEDPPKIWSRHPPKIWSRHPLPPKIWSRHPPKIWSRHPPRKFGAGTPPKIWSRHPPRKFGAGTPPKIWSRHPPCEQNS